ncbi:hypothetical protein ACAG26_16960 [Mycobacterium sp. pUA109]|uniref:hypothetical protein n=1 Tax=Mycobacterium sp. pUA109 TaxID=3238982 RepID=UPI00351B8416
MRRWAGPGYALMLALLVVAPLLGPGYLLLRDAVSTPRSYLSDAALGLGESAPRATPQDFAVAAASHLVDGGVVVKALLLVGLWLAGCGAARLVATVLPASGRPGQFVAITVAIWNPYVAERLLQGHWSLLVGYGCLPWVAATTLALRTSGPAGNSGERAQLHAQTPENPYICARSRAWPGFFALAFWLALAGLTPTGLILAATVALVCLVPSGAGRPRWQCAAVTLAAAAVAALPWLLGWTLGAACCTPDAAPGVDAFAARAEPGLGTLGSLASLGGIWNAEAVPGSRTTLFTVAAAVVMLGVVAAGLPAVLRRRPALPLLVLAAVAVLVPAALATGPGLAVLRALLDAVPGLGVLRDGQKWVALAMPGYALAAAGAVLTARRWLAPAVTAVACCVAVLAGLPDLAWGAWGKVAPVHYPSGWAAVAARINADPRPVAVLPADSMRRFAWAGAAPVLDPLPRWVRANVWATGDLNVAGHTVPGEGARARDVQRLLLAGADPAALSNAGVGWVVVESGGELGAAAKTLDRVPVAYRDSDLALYRLRGDTAGAGADRRRAAVAAHLAWLALLVAGGTGAAVAGWRRREHDKVGSDG